MPDPAIAKIVSGGQTGVDRAALDVAIALKIPHGGWCPRGRRAEDGPISNVYQLTETPSPKYVVRTEKNVVCSDGTLILFRNRMTRGTALTASFTRRRSKPCLAIDIAQMQSPGYENASGLNSNSWGVETIDKIHQWLTEEGIQILNVAGPRESTSNGISADAQTLLLAALIE